MNRIFDPVGHGATTIRYSSIPSENIHHLAEVLQKGWNLQDLKEIQKIEAYSAARSVNYRITSAERELVLKRSLINSVSMQEFQHQYMKFLRESGLHIPEVIPSSDGTTYSENSELYCLYQFIGGEYFDGSRDELDSAARNIALLEQVLKRMPFQEEIKIRKGSLIHHDYNALEELEKSIHSSRRSWAIRRRSWWAITATRCAMTAATCVRAAMRSQRLNPVAISRACERLRIKPARNGTLTSTIFP